MLGEGAISAPSGRVAQLDRVSASGAEHHPAAARFWAKVEKTDGCWNWTGAVTSSGYGSFGLVTMPKPRMVSAHKISWAWANGTIPEGLVVMHTCDNRRCVRPDHLRIGTVADNNADMHGKGRWHRGPQRCGLCRTHGHDRRTCKAVQP